jgi:hypothetical protein
MLSLPIAFRSAIGVFAPVFSRPVWQHVKVLLTGAVLAPGQRTVTAILRIMGLSAAPNFQTYHRVSLNLSHFVAHKIWRRCGGSPLCGRAHRLQRREPLQCLLVPMDITIDLLQTAIN